MVSIAASPAAAEVRVSGSTTVNPVVVVAAAVLRDELGLTIRVDTLGGSSGGIAALALVVSGDAWEGGVLTVQGNYEESLAGGRDDCNCGYTDPRDKHFADLSYRYTAEHTSVAFKTWMGSLPRRRRVSVGHRELLLIHGSPRRTNEFLFHSTTPVSFLEVLLDQERAAGLLCTHTGLHWHRRLPTGRDVVNVGLIARPANNGDNAVWYALLEDRGENLGVELVRSPYDHHSLATEMRCELLPQEFVDTILSGWWTTCLEILPARERAHSRY